MHSGGGVIVPRKKSERNAGRTVIYQNWSRSHLLIPTPILCNNQCALKVRESITIPVLECKKDVKNHRKKYQRFGSLKTVSFLIYQHLISHIWMYGQRYTYRVLQTIQIKLVLLCVWADPASLSSTKTALKLKYQI